MNFNEPIKGRKGVASKQTLLPVLITKQIHEIYAALIIKCKTKTLNSMEFEDHFTIFICTHFFPIRCLLNATNIHTYNTDYSNTFPFH